MLDSSQHLTKLLTQYHRDYVELKLPCARNDSPVYLEADDMNTAKLACCLSVYPSLVHLTVVLPFSDLKSLIVSSSS